MYLKSKTLILHSTLQNKSHFYVFKSVTCLLLLFGVFIFLCLKYFFYQFRYYAQLAKIMVEKKICMTTHMLVYLHGLCLFV